MDRGCPPLSLAVRLLSNPGIRGGTLTFCFLNLMASNKIVCDLFQNQFLTWLSMLFQMIPFLKHTHRLALSPIHQSWWFWAAIGTNQSGYTILLRSSLRSTNSALLLRSKMGWGDPFNTWKRYAHCRILHEKMKWIEHWMPSTEIVTLHPIRMIPFRGLRF